MVKLVARSTLSQEFVESDAFPVQTTTLQIAELPLSGILRVQGRRTDSGFVAAVEETLGVELPVPSRMESNEDVTITWAGPNEYLCFCPLESEERYEKALRDSLQGTFSAVTVVSDSRFGVRVAGPNSAMFIAQGCSIDMHYESFPIGRAVTTRFASLTALLIHRARQEYVVFFDIGYVEYVLKWLIAESQEFRHVAA
ncbi:sarcosine oxidase subunit gamma [Paraburkholderia phenoliruptrix]|uniref:sarcosine oxidase subunit gamma n=1 Tax=Paraburkholderia phenoliruptrix TaxID=252970 RepID=UPI002869997A|nr:sarcosine oxidase subunit gamma family protein [Paraburkholderia phenoliruptrix]WMY11068.1 sarcosine oxidase subunit gamma family protein [Paraburkholderia phenoliruptrix]